MKRSETGRYVETSVGGEKVRAFVPLPLPPVPPLAFDPYCCSIPQSPNASAFPEDRR